AIEHHPRELSQIFDEEGEEGLSQVPSVGAAINKKIQELLTTGRLEYYEKLKAEFPDGVINLMDVPGVGPKTAYKISKELGVSTVEELETALKSGAVAGLPGLGEKAAANILRHVQTLRTKDRRIPLWQALSVVEEIIGALRACDGVHQMAPAGSLRRYRETIGDIDIMGTAEDPEMVINTLVELPQVVEVLVHGPKKASVLVHKGLQVDLRIVEDGIYGSLIQYFTGSQQHNVLLRERARRQGLSLNEYGITDLETGEVEKFAAEEDFYGRLGLQFIPPELREGQHEIEKAAEGAIPRLVETSDIRGDLHSHTTASDGRDSLEEMARAAKDSGLEYIAITEHSVGRGIANGLNEERLRDHMARIGELNNKLDGIELLTGSEVDIRADGSLDYPDELLRELDVVIGSVHSAMGQDEDVMTARIIKAMQNPHIDIIGHPTCRLIGSREPVEVKMEAIFRAALETGTALEIDAQPSRLDLKDSYIYRAREMGVVMVIDTDSHAVDQFGNMRLGTAIARRGWCEPRHILNTKPLEELKACFDRHS
ncbi:MAG: DNA polymerase/3'-5' exonuclease PolX, partial [Dehalococcoidia bacterium]